MDLSIHYKMYINGYCMILQLNVDGSSHVTDEQSVSENEDLISLEKAMGGVGPCHLKTLQEVGHLRCIGSYRNPKKMERLFLLKQQIPFLPFLG